MLVMFCQCFISPSSQVLASANDLFGTTLKFCLLSFSTTSGDLTALVTAVNRASNTGFGVAAGANRPFQATVPTSGEPDFFHRRNVGVFLEPRVIDHRQWVKFPGAYLPCRRRDVEEGGLGIAAQQILDHA